MQKANGVPLNFYDHIAVLFPGAILLGYFVFITNRIFPFTIKYVIVLKNFSSPLLILAFLILSFIFGHIAYSISKWSFDLARFSKKGPVDKFLDYSSVKQEEIITEVEKIYGQKIGDELRFNAIKYKNNKINGSQFGLKNYCYALVERKESKHDMFVALADFLRSTAFLIVVSALYIFIRVLISYFVSNVSVPNLLITVGYEAVLLLACTLLYKRSIRMRKAADSLIYSQFLYDAKKSKQ